MGMAGAMIGVGVAAAAGGVASASIGGSAAKSAAKTQAAAAETAADKQMQMFGQAKETLQPYVDLGTSAMPMYKNLLGLGTGGQADIQKTLESTPGYQFTRDQGLQAVQAGQASMGLAGSGSAIKAAEQYAAGLADTTYETRLNDYLRSITTGAGAAESLAGMGIQSQNIANQYTTSGAAATAGGTVGAANAATGGINSAVSSLSNAALLYGMYNSGMFGMTGGARS